MLEPENDFTVLASHLSAQSPFDIEIVVRYLIEVKAIDESPARELASDPNAEEDDPEEFNRFWCWYEQNYFIPEVTPSE
jgi:hypothetical protein